MKNSQFKWSRQIKSLMLFVSAFFILISLVACSSQIDQNGTRTENLNERASSLKDDILPFKCKRQMTLYNLDALGRARGSHIQLRDSDENFGKRAPLTYDPVGWHNYNFYIGQGSKKAWLMSRGHLVGYQFCGLNNEPRNLVPEPQWFNAGNYDGMDSSNQASMLYYEDRLDSWLSNHPHYWLDYKVTPLYQGNELVPRQIALQYVGIDEKGDLLKISLGGKEYHDNKGVGHVVLDNVSPNAKIDYATGRAENIVGPGEKIPKSAYPSLKPEKADEKQKKDDSDSSSSKSYSASSSSSKENSSSGNYSNSTKNSKTEANSDSNSNSKRTVYVTSNGRSNAYWYSIENMPSGVNKKNIVKMTEGEAIQQGKHHVSFEK